VSFREVFAVPVQLEHSFGLVPEPRRVYTEPPQLQPQRQQQRRIGRKPSRRIMREVALRVLGAVALSALFCLLQARIVFQENWRPQLASEWRFGLPFGDWPLDLGFLLGLAGAGYQAVARRRIGPAVLAGFLGFLLAGPLWLGLGTLISPLIEAIQNSRGPLSIHIFVYLMHLSGLMPPALFLFATWCAALGTCPRRAMIGSGQFALVTYLLFQLRDCFLTPSLWSQWQFLLPAALLVFVLPATLLGGLGALLARLSTRVLGHRSQGSG
jgi:hypothetical protein